MLVQFAVLYAALSTSIQVRLGLLLALNSVITVLLAFFTFRLIKALLSQRKLVKAVLLLTSKFVKALL